MKDLKESEGSEELEQFKESEKLEELGGIEEFIEESVESGQWDEAAGGDAVEATASWRAFWSVRWSRCWRRGLVSLLRLLRRLALLLLAALS